MKALETLGRVRLSENFFMRDFLYSEIASFYGMPNIPDDPDRAIASGRQLCTECLEPLQARFGRISIRSGYRSPRVNHFGNERNFNCGSNQANHARHIWDHLDDQGSSGAMATVVVNAFIPYYEASGHWEALAWWVHDHLPYSELEFFPKFAAFNLGWKELPRRRIYSFIPPRRGVLTDRARSNSSGDHSEEYDAWLETLRPPATAPESC